MKFRLTVTQWRILVLCVNFVLAAFVLGHVGYRFLGSDDSRDDEIIRKLMRPQPKDFASRPGGAKGRNRIAEVNGLGVHFVSPSELVVEPVVPVVVEPGPDEVPGSGEEPIEPVEGIDEPVYSGGPLEESYQFVACICFGDPRDSRNRAILAPKPPDPKAGKKKAPTKVSVRERAGSRGRGRNNPRGVRAGKIKETRKTAADRRKNKRKTRGRKKKKVENKSLVTAESWLLNEGEEEETTVRVHSISPDLFVYRDANKKLYKLERVEKALYGESDDGRTLSPEEEEEEEDEEVEEEKPKQFFVKGHAVTYKEKYQRWLDGEGEEQGEDEGPEGSEKATPGNKIKFDTRPARDRIKEERDDQPERKKVNLKETMSKIRDSKKFKNLSEKDKKALEIMEKLGQRKGR